MTKNQAAGAIVGIELLAWITHHLVGVVLVTIVFILIDLITIRVHPRVRHTGFGSCHGSGESRNFLFPWHFHRYSRCNGGRLISPMAARFGTEEIRNEAALAKEGRKARKEQHRWR